MNDTSETPARFYAVIDPSTIHGEFWGSLGIDALPILDHCSIQRRVRGELTEIYLVDVEGLEPELLRLVLLGLARKFGLHPHEVCMRILGNNGLPILAEAVRVCRDPDEGRAYFAERRLP